jgi:hypothetical protein
MKGQHMGTTEQGRGVRPLYHILYAARVPYEDEIEVRQISTETMQGVIENMITRDLTPGGVVVILGAKVAVDQGMWGARMAEIHTMNDKKHEAQERAQLAFLKAKYEQEA